VKIGAVIQARMSSTRLPDKVLKELPYRSGVTALQQIARRLKRSDMINEIIIATTTDDEDRAIVSAADAESVRWFRGSKHDVLSRYYQAAKENKLDIVVRLTGDCPCIDPEIADRVITEHIGGEADFTSNVIKRTFPHGMDVEVINFHALEIAHKEAKGDYEREHVMPYIYMNNAARFKVIGFEASRELYAPDIRITLDTGADYVLLCAVFDYLYPDNAFFGTRDIINLFYEKPWLKLINENVLQKKICDTLEDEIEEALKVLDLQDLKRAKEFLKKSKDDLENYKG
jgi:spore coat polysaccharide biosynthesis protein SpsF